MQAILIAVAVASLGGSAARAGDGPADALVTSAKHRYQMRVPGSWAAREVAGGAVAGYSGRGGLWAVVSRIDHPNRDAWRGVRSYFASVERGVAEASPGFVRRNRRTHRLGRVPALDLEFTRRGGQVDEWVFMRFVFFRNYSMVLTAALPTTEARQRWRQVRERARSFVPFFAE